MSAESVWVALPGGVRYCAQTPAMRSDLLGACPIFLSVNRALVSTPTRGRVCRYTGNMFCCSGEGKKPPASPQAQQPQRDPPGSQQGSLMFCFATAAEEKKIALVCWEAAGALQSSAEGAPQHDSTHPELSPSPQPLRPGLELVTTGKGGPG